MTFVDTGVWYASYLPAEWDYPVARRLLDEHAEHLLTTDYVVDETLTLLRARRFPRSAIRAGETFFKDGVVRVERVTDEDYQQAWDVFASYTDKDRSFTDCTSLVVMRRLGITTALSLDHHFRQFGTVRVLP